MAYFRTDGSINLLLHNENGRIRLLTECVRSLTTYRLPLGLFGRCVNADAATLRTGFGVLGFLSNLLAMEPTGREVLSFLPMARFTPSVLG
jgi:hypothetical protein